MRGPPPAHLLQIEGMTLKFFIKLTGYNIANPTSEYTIIKIGKDEENSNSNDLPILIEEESRPAANGVPAAIDGAEKKQDMAHEAEKNEEETPQM
ncbi:unnamed protein product [Linum trigynum]|uniref:Uncharacterized protein n=1 Tax=Linum trigynum TaxID=586398 RepID=A0AAV2E2B8_9ROSI